MQNQLLKKLLYRTHSASVSSSMFRLLSTSLPSAESIPENPPPKSASAVEYLVKSCGLPTERAIVVSKYISHFTSYRKPDSILQFLREVGLSDSDIRKALGSDPQLLCASLENMVKPRIREAQEVGFSPSQIAQLISIAPGIFRSCYGGSLQEKIKFWIPFFGTFERMLSVLKKSQYLLNVSVEKVVEPNISFLEKHCGISQSQIMKMIVRGPSLLSYNPNKLKEAAQRAEDLGFRRGSGLFLYALQITFQHTPDSLDAKINNLKNIGFCKKEIDSMIVKQPMLLTNSNERIHKIIDFLTSDAGLDLAYISRRPALIMYSLEQRLIPRNYFLKTLQAKGLLENFTFYTSIYISEERFACKFVRPYKDIIPEECEAFEAACAGQISLKGKL